MTTLAERQQWLRAGCPVPGCQSFRLKVWPWTQQIWAICTVCDAVKATSRIAIDGLNMANAVRPTIRDGSITGAMWNLCPWMDEHAGVVEGTAADCMMNYDPSWERVKRWVRVMMMVGLGREATNHLRREILPVGMAFEGSARPANTGEGELDGLLKVRYHLSTIPVPEGAREP